MRISRGALPPPCSPSATSLFIAFYKSTPSSLMAPQHVRKILFRSVDHQVWGEWQGELGRCRFASGRLEYGLRSLGSATFRMLGFFSNKLPEDISPGLALVLETK